MLYLLNFLATLNSDILFSLLDNFLWSTSKFHSRAGRTHSTRISSSGTRLPSVPVRERVSAGREVEREARIRCGARGARTGSSFPGVSGDGEQNQNGVAVGDRLAQRGRRSHSHGHRSATF